MQWIREPQSLGPCVLVLGMFDGVHRGHQTLLDKGLEIAEAKGLPLVVCTFEPHPLEVLRPDLAPKRLTTPLERAGLMAQCGADILAELRFTRELADMEPEAFLSEMSDRFHPDTVVCGYNFSFGRGGKGDGEFLQARAKDHGFDAIIVPAVCVAGKAVSSTRIRGCLAAGDVSEAARLLGHTYTLSGRVQHGKQQGRTMGFPTANVGIPPRKQLPAYGVYACGVLYRGEEHPAIVNVGRHPTLPEGDVTVEAHILDDSADLYDEAVRVSFLRHLRPEKPFRDKEELTDQLKRDRLEAISYFGMSDVADGKK
ncbi:MAG: bifunctional riboflavin kinase/FAD synthetase [Clostridia bacterium]|nr:bifunctional riboflavin kinase/FAD synthetase [Clostridia bacterium]